MTVFVVKYSDLKISWGKFIGTAGLFGAYDRYALWVEKLKYICRVDKLNSRSSHGIF